MVYSSLFFDIIPALGRGGAKASEKDSTEVSLLQQAIRRANKPRVKAGSVDALKAYVTKASGEVFNIEDSYLTPEEEEVLAEEEAPVPVEAATAGAP